MCISACMSQAAAAASLSTWCDFLQSQNEKSPTNVASGWLLQANFKHINKNNNNNVEVKQLRMSRHGAIRSPISLDAAVGQFGLNCCCVVWSLDCGMLTDAAVKTCHISCPPFAVRCVLCVACNRCQLIVVARLLS